MISRTIILTNNLPFKTLREVVGRLPAGTAVYMPQSPQAPSTHWTCVRRCENGEVEHQSMEAAPDGMPIIDAGSSITTYKLVDLLTNALYPAEKSRG